ncbi:MAG: hypothetical protein Kow00117_06700 [Phototrophicales bacterium]
MATQTLINRQIRGFAFAWTGLTILVGMIVFFAIYLTYNTSNPLAQSQGISLPNGNGTGDNNVALPIASEATDVPAATPVPTLVAAAPIAQQPETIETGNQPTIMQDSPQPVPTILPVNVPDYQVGIQVQYSLDLNPDTQRIWMNDVNALGLNWIKQQVRWEEIEINPGEYNWAKLDLVLPIAHEYGFKVLVSVVAAPDWAREPGADLTEDGPPADLQDFANFLTAMMTRYPGYIHAIEVWNEPNLKREWASPNGLDAARFVEMMRIAYTTIKNLDPGVIVVSGALSPTGGYVVPETGEVTAIDDFDYLDQALQAGLLSWTECVGAHHNGYNIGPSVTWDNVVDDPTAQFRGPFDNPHHSWSFASTLQTYANKIAVAGGWQRLCVTEFGWAVAEDLEGVPDYFGFALDNTLEEQAQWTIEALNNMEEWGIVWLAFIWNLNYGPQAGWSTESDNTPYSLIGPGFTRRPAFDAIAEWTAARNTGN